MDNPGTTIEEYVQYETEKALRQGQVNNWEIAKYGKISWYLDDVNINVLIFFETKFPAIVYDDALKTESNFSSKPELNPGLTNDINLENKKSLPECNYEKYDSKAERKALKKWFSKKENFNILNIAEYLFSYEIPSANNLQLNKGNDDDKIEMPLNTIKNLYVSFGIPFDPKLFYKDGGYTSIAEAKDFESRLGRIYNRQVHRVHDLDFDVLTEDMDRDITERLRMDHTDVEGKIREPLRRLCHRLIAFTIARRGQEPEKVTTINLFFLRSMDEGTVVNVLYLLAHYLVIKEQSLQALGVEVHRLTTIDSDKLVRLRIYKRLGDVVTWLGPQRQQVNPTPQAAAPAPRTIAQRVHRLEEEGLRFGLMEDSGIGYLRFDGSIIGSSHVPYERRRVRQRTTNASTSADLVPA
ncbi:hypothetical protein Tco_0866008 [Tanacetum coccineum]